MKFLSIAREGDLRFGRLNLLVGGREILLSEEFQDEIFIEQWQKFLLDELDDLRQLLIFLLGTPLALLLFQLILQLLKASQMQRDMRVQIGLFAE